MSKFINIVGEGRQSIFININNIEYVEKQMNDSWRIRTVSGDLLEGDKGYDKIIIGIRSLIEIVG